MSAAQVACGVQPKRLHRLLVDCLLREKVEFWEGHLAIKRGF